MNDRRYPSSELTSPGPSILTVLLLLNVAAYLLSLFALPPVAGEPPAGALSLDALHRGEWWAVLTHIFTHESVWHLAPNVFLLWLAGRAVQRSAGPQHFVYIFLFSAWAGAAISLCFRPDNSLIGASGGVMGVIGAFSALHPEYDLMHRFRRFLPLRLRAKHLFPALLAVNIGLEIATRLTADLPLPDLYRQAHLVHAGGVLAGWLWGRRLATEGHVHDEWRDFFPQGLRRRRIEEQERSLMLAGTPQFPPAEQERSQPAAPAPSGELSDTDFLRERVDPVLEKLYSAGADNLTPAEKAVLEEASRRFSRRP